MRVKVTRTGLGGAVWTGGLDGTGAEKGATTGQLGGKAGYTAMSGSNVTGAGIAEGDA